MPISRILCDRIHLLLTLSWSIVFVHMMLVIISQMNIQRNSYDFPRCQRHPVPLVWTYQFREFVVARNIYLWPFLNYYVCARGACNYIPNEYLKELLWYSTIPTAPALITWTYQFREFAVTGNVYFWPLLEILCVCTGCLQKYPKWISKGTPMISHDVNGTLFPWCGHTSFENLLWPETFNSDPFLNYYVCAQGAYKIFQMNIQGNTYDIPRPQWHPAPLERACQFWEFTNWKHLFLTLS